MSMIIRSFALACFALGLLSLLGCMDVSLHTRVTGFDAPAKPGETVTLMSKYEGPGVFILRPDIPWRTIEFYEGDRLLGKAGTNLDGMARLKCSFTEEGFHKITLCFAGDHARGIERASMWVLVAKEDTPFVVIDIDNTICESNILANLFVRLENHRPIKGAAEALSGLSSRYSIIYLTARDESAVNLTREWLEKNGFPRGIILARDLDLLAPSSSRFKSAALKDLNQRFTRVCAGIGNREGDGRAFQRNGLLAILFHENEKHMTGVKFIKDWKEVDEALNALATSPGAPGEAYHSKE